MPSETADRSGELYIVEVDGVKKIKTKPMFFCSENASFRITAARSATISGITPGNRVPRCGGGPDHTSQISGKRGPGP